MAKRDIMRAAKRAGMEIKDAIFSWQATPGEMVPGWDVVLTEESAEKFGVDEDQFFDNSEQAVEWIAEQAECLGSGDGKEG